MRMIEMARMRLNMIGIKHSTDQRPTDANAWRPTFHGVASHPHSVSSGIQAAHRPKPRRYNRCMKSAALLLASLSALHGETRSMTLRQAVTMAVQQNPDVALARFDEENAR